MWSEDWLGRTRCVEIVRVCSQKVVSDGKSAVKEGVARIIDGLNNFLCKHWRITL